MKKFLAIGAASVLVAAAAFGQGTVSFKNYFGNAATDPAVLFTDGTKAHGSQYVIALMAGAQGGSLSQVATASFITTASGYGFFLGGVATIPGIAAGGPASIQIDVWDATLNGTTTGATFAQAQSYALTASVANEWGQSAMFNLASTGNPTLSPPGTPVSFQGILTGFGLNPVPEPTTFALAGLGAAAALIFRRRR